MRNRTNVTLLFKVIIYYLFIILLLNSECKYYKHSHFHNSVNIFILKTIEQMIFFRNSSQLRVKGFTRGWGWDSNQQPSDWIPGGKPHKHTWTCKLHGSSYPGIEPVTFCCGNLVERPSYTFYVLKNKSIAGTLCCLKMIIHPKWMADSNCAPGESILFDSLCIVTSLINIWLY